MSLIIRCPQCKASLQVADDVAGKPVRCPKCAATFLARADAPAPALAEPVTGCCTHCQQPVRIPAAALGQPMRCPRCAGVFVAALPPTPAPTPMGVQKGPDVPAAQRPPSPPPPPPPARREEEDEAPAAPERLPDEQAPDAPPARPGRGKTRQAPFRFKVGLVDPKGQLSGYYRAEVNDEGLKLQPKTGKPMLVPRGSDVQSISQGKFSVPVRGRRVRLRVQTFIFYEGRLARDVVAYLRGERATLAEEGYWIPWYLLLVPALPLAIPVCTLGGLIPMVLGMGFAGAAFAVIRVERLPPALRVGLSLGLALMAYVGLGAFLFALAHMRGFTLPANARVRAWVPEPAQPNFTPPVQPEPEPGRPVKEEKLPAGMRLYKKPDQDLAALAFTRDGAALWGAGRNGALYRWDTASGEQTSLQTQLNDEMSGIALTPDGRTAAISGLNGPLQLFDLTTGQARAQLTGKSGLALWGVALSRDGAVLASGHGTNEVRLWDVEKGALLKELKGHTSQVMAVAFSTDGKLLASGSMDTTMKVWDVAAGKEQASMPTGEGGAPDRSVRAVAFSPDGLTVAVGGDEGVLRLYDVQQKRSRATLRLPAAVSSVAYSSDGRHVASATGDGDVQLWDAATGKRLALREADPFPRGSNLRPVVAFTPDGASLAVSRPWRLEIWDLKQVLRP